MATSEVEICNRALDLVTTRSTISSLDEASVEAEACSRWFERIRDQLLRAAHWNFAKQTATLALLKQAPGTPGSSVSSATVWSDAYPPPPWLYSYATPDDCLLVRYVLGQGQGGTTHVPIFGAPTTSYDTGLPARFEVRSGVVNTNAYQALAVFTAKVTDVNEWDQQFVVAMEHALASMIGPTLTGDRARSLDLMQMANSAILEARVSDGNEGLTILDHIPDWIMVRTDGTASAAFVAPYGPLLTSGV